MAVTYPTPHQTPPGAASSEVAPAGGPQAARGPSRRGIARIRPWLLLAPALLILGVLLLWPLARVAMFSLQDYGLREIVSGSTNWIGFANFTEILSSRDLWAVVLPNTVGFAVLSVTGTVVFGTLVALLLQSLAPRTRGFVTGAIMAAWAMPAVTGTYVWVWIFDADHGVFNQVLT